MTKDLIAGEADKGEEAMEGIVIKAKHKTGFLYCPRCGLRKPRNEIFGYYGGCCPFCGTRMVVEGPLPYSSTKLIYARQLSNYVFKKGIRNEDSSRIERWY